MQETLSRIDGFVADTRHAVFVRRVDRLLLIRPEKTLAVNDSALTILEGLYRQDRRPAAEVVVELASRLGASPERIAEDAWQLLLSVRAFMCGDFSPRANIRYGTYDRSIVRFPILAEIALTYGCQNRCAFCYASSPHREGEHRLMRTAEVKRVMEKIFREGHVPSLSFTGGEATLRPDLPELIKHGRELGLRVNLITNGVRAGDEGYAASLVDAGLHSAQVSLEAATAELHDRIVGRPGAFEATVQSVRNFRRLGIHVHTNTTLCSENLASAPDLIRFAARSLEIPTLSMNLLIRTGAALASDALAVSYTEIARHIPALAATAKEEGIRFVWYSPIPYCIFNPVLHGLGAKS